MKARSKKTSNTRTQPMNTSPALRENERWLKIEELCELYQVAPIVRNSYVLSRFWAWFTRIQVNPRVSVPIPRFMTQRDP
jgi:hypothetical protein